MPLKKKQECCPPEENIDRPIFGKEAEADLAAFSNALSHPVRVQILRLLTEKESCICGEIVDGINLPQSTTSQHLKVLKDVGLIRGDIDGPRTCYCINQKALKRFKVLIASL